jgi:hypothetical protein
MYVHPYTHTRDITLLLMLSSFGEDIGETASRATGFSGVVTPDNGEEIANADTVDVDERLVTVDDARLLLSRIAFMVVIITGTSEIAYAHACIFSQTTHCFFYSSHR